ncbi:multidrug effflux MFS transporter [Serratia rhizosphaerae]|uniref:Bcr/CflA family efflux transporter n=1 Tax=Serratia rhizosphaerae TaxID=2597702 RepID=A0ABX6GSG1_9GAMM|nr:MULTISPECIES: multidrug effflux MFS transporter [Serratia]MBU3894819.1 multidrug effflux MFS transporter [Serratia rubidaea]MEB6335964.1 multidrug effflux MFS transporter [Serratia rhizosphaerae]QHA89223.1 multidrug effflux MFS transporter [Serratia rhizosphaerae]QNK34498.1 multidrug effflux MFS transporter [Serratia sp. JUb9]QPT11600.1 multidrug effflux MFS transporter [Serratia rubidaea]
MQKFLLLLLSLVLLGPLGIDLYLPAIPAIALGLNSSEAVIQSTISLFILVLGLGQIVAGPLVDNYGRKPVALAGIILYMIGAAMAALANSPTLFIASRLLQGIAVCCTAVVAFSGVRDRMNGDDAARAFGFLNGTLNIIPALAPLLGGLLAEAFGWRAPFWFLVGYALLVFVLIALRLPETRPADTRPVKGLPVRQYAQILRQSRFLSFAVVNAGAMGMALTYVSLAPNVLMGTAGLTPLQFSLAFGANGFWIMLVSFFANRVIRKVGRPFCLATGGVLMGLGCLALLFDITFLTADAQTHWLAYMLPVAIGCAGLAFVMGPATSYALEPYSNEAGVASALVGFVQMAGGAALGLLAMALPLQPKMALALVMAAGCLLALHARQRSKQLKGQLNRIG